MRRKIFNVLLFGLLILFNLLFTLKYLANNNRTIAMNKILDDIDQAASLAGSNLKDIPADDPTSANLRVANLKSFFRNYSSPLYDHADHIVTTSDKYGLDYRLLPAIAMQESTLCKFIPQNSHNCWGWGIYGNTVTRFSSYEEAIETVAKGLKKNYIDKGRTTPTEIMAAYTPSSNGSWANGVNSILRILE